MTERRHITDTQDLAAELMEHGITLRPINNADLAFLCHVYASTRLDELAQVNWSVEEKAAFLSMQFSAQHSYYQEHYPSAAFQIIERQGQPIGRLYLDRWADELRIVDIALLPEHRGHGLGSTLLRAILCKGQALKVPVRIHVEMFNPALRLYTRLGFQQIQDKGVYYLMEKAPDA